MSTQHIIDIIGWIGSVEVILAYALISARKIDSHSHLYQWLNLTGALFLIINTAYYGAYPSTFINIVWVAIAAWALVRINFRKVIN